MKHLHDIHVGRYVPGGWYYRHGSRALHYFDSMSITSFVNAYPHYANHDQIINLDRFMTTRLQDPICGAPQPQRNYSSHTLYASSYGYRHCNSCVRALGRRA